ncbi:hypothetical protein VN97_g5357, partial [Penicillium thymicola]
SCDRQIRPRKCQITSKLFLDLDGVTVVLNRALDIVSRKAHGMEFPRIHG